MPNVGIKGMSKYVQRFNEDATLYVNSEKCPGYVATTMEDDSAFGRDSHGNVICPIVNDKLMRSGVPVPVQQPDQQAAAV